MAVAEHTVGLLRGHKRGLTAIGTDHVLRSPLEYFTTDTGIYPLLTLPMAQRASTRGRGPGWREVKSQNDERLPNLPMAQRASDCEYPLGP
eukprot:4514395-Prymnesium_polylepis.1